MSDDILVSNEEELIVGDDPLEVDDTEEVEEELPLDPELEEEEENEDDEMLSYLYGDIEN